MMNSLSQSDKALYFIEDILDGAMIKYFLLGKTARSIYDSNENDLEGPIEIGIRKQHLTDSGLSILKQMIPQAIFTNKKITLEHEGVPIEILIIHNNYSFFECPDTKYFKIAQFFVPNPFEAYWKARNFIK